MPPHHRRPVSITAAQARRVWLAAQRLDRSQPFGAGPDATAEAVAHLGYVQIDTINVIERCHHHILWTRIPDYRREDLAQAQSQDRSVFEYWTHALAYVPSTDFRFFIPAMKARAETPKHWFGSIDPADVRRLLKRIRDQGPLTIRDIDDDVLVDKDHPWASRKPSKRALQHAFFTGALTISARIGMLKTSELTSRHFGWERPPRPATERQILDYQLDRALRAQGLVSLDSVCYLDAPRKRPMRELIEARVARRRLLPVTIESVGKVEHWAEPKSLEPEEAGEPATHLLSPFDPLVIQRRRLQLFFGYEHRFEAYLPKEKRLYGYFALPVLIGDRIVAVVDLKTDRAGRALKIQQWTWVDEGGAEPSHKAAIDAELHRFETFQLRAGEGAEAPPEP